MLQSPSPPWAPFRPPVWGRDCPLGQGLHAWREEWGGLGAVWMSWDDTGRSDSKAKELLVVSVGRKALPCVWGPCGSGTGLGGHGWSEHSRGIGMSPSRRGVGARVPGWHCQVALEVVSGFPFPSFLLSATAQCPSQRGDTSSNDMLSGGQRCNFICVEKYTS